MTEASSASVFLYVENWEKELLKPLAFQKTGAYDKD